MTQTIKIAADNVEVFYGDKRALHGVSLNILSHHITALIGPSGCGKSTFLRCLNRMNDRIEGCRVKGSITFDGQDLYAPTTDPVLLRSRIGMVFQKPNPFPKSIYDNVAYGPRIHGLVSGKNELDARVEESLTQAGLWNEVKDRLNDLGTSLSGGQQQRLCIARTLAIKPEVILMDEPCSALDPIATAKIEHLMNDLKKHYTLVIVTHSMQQARRISDRTAFFNLGEIIEEGNTQNMFDAPKLDKTRDYLQGKFG